MTREEKNKLLLIDLSARLSYGVKCEVDYLDKPYVLESIKNNILFLFGHGIYGRDVTQFKPYLRPISSMTDDEMDRLFEILHIDEDSDETDWIKITYGNVIKFFFPSGRYADDVAKAFDYLNSIYIDYRGLIPMGLALEAKEGMYE